MKIWRKHQLDKIVEFSDWTHSDNYRDEFLLPLDEINEMWSKFYLTSGLEHNMLRHSKMAALSCGVTLVRGPSAMALLLLLLWRTMVVVQGINVTACCPPFRQHICHSFVNYFTRYWSIFIACYNWLSSYWLLLSYLKFWWQIIFTVIWTLRPRLARQIHSGNVLPRRSFVPVL